MKKIAAETPKNAPLEEQNLQPAPVPTDQQLTEAQRTMLLKHAEDLSKMGWGKRLWNSIKVGWKTPGQKIDLAFLLGFPTAAFFTAGAVPALATLGSIGAFRTTARVAGGYLDEADTQDKLAQMGYRFPEQVKSRVRSPHAKKAMNAVESRMAA